MSRNWYLSGNIDAAWQQLDVDESAVAAFVDREAEKVRWALAILLDRIDSPIERKLLLALITTDGGQGIWVPPERRVSVPVDGLTEVTNFGGDDGGSFVLIESQRPVGKYFCDLTVTWNWRSEGDEASATVCVEADGHDFHQKTKEQAAHDKKRDRFFAAQGLTLLRFTGSEIHRAPGACASEVFALLDSKLRPILAAAYAARRSSP